MKNELDMIKACHDALPGPSAKASARAWNRLAAEAEAAPPPFAGPIRPPGRGLRRLAFRAGVVVALVSAVSVGMVVVGADDGSTPLSIRPANAAELLQYAAAASLKEPRPRPDQFIYQDRRAVQWHFGMSAGDEFEATQEIRREYWVPAEGSGESVTRSTYGKDVATRGKLSKNMMTPEGTVKYFRGDQCGWTSSSSLHRDADAIPTDPAALVAQVRQEAEKDVRDPSAYSDTPAEEEIPRLVDGQVIYRLIELAQSPFATPEIRATVFRALSTTQSATVKPDLTDPAGRRGIGTEITWAGVPGRHRAELVFEPETFRLLGWRSFEDFKRSDGSVEEIMVVSMALMSTTIVDSTPEVPEGEDGTSPC
ncbi:CU044_5270 family protein [Nonomuraea sp. NPDC059194]|uniref:CU044_5270 family protein n=1 Tax=Nonomuraea sp. NPDC059194 TaxID=3346764 RepID=UPI0036C2E303